MNVPSDVYQGNPASHLKIKKVGDKFVGTSSHFPGKEWSGPDEQTVGRKHMQDLHKMHGERTIHTQMGRPKWMDEETAKKGSKGFRRPAKVSDSTEAVKDPRASAVIHPVRKGGRSAEGSETPLPPEC